MGKKKTRAKYTSKGQRNSVSRRLCKATQDRSPMTIEMNKWDAFLHGKKVFFTIDNPNKNQTNKRQIRVEGKILYGDFRKYNDRHIIR